MSSEARAYRGSIDAVAEPTPAPGRRLGHREATPSSGAARVELHRPPASRACMKLLLPQPLASLASATEARWQVSWRHPAITGRRS